MREFNKEDLETEIWKDLKGYENYIRVSSLGRFMRKSRGRFKELIMTLGYYSNGYEQFSIIIDKTRYTAIAHRLVATHFISNPENKPNVNHKNGIKDDNRVCNLEWVTQLENIHHSIKILGTVSPKGNDSPCSKLTEEEVKNIIKLRETEKISFRKIAKIYNLSYSTIQNIFSRRTWKHI